MSSSKAPTSSYSNPILGPIVRAAVSSLTRPVTLYSASEVTNIRILKKRLIPGDVLLVCGDARVSHVVKVLTLSQWSHVVLYVGDRRDLLSQQEQENLIAKYGEASLKHLVIDADPLSGVHLKPLDDSVGLMIRHCRPEAIKSKDLDTVIDIALAQLGREYDISHIIRLLFFFAIPWEIFPEIIKRLVRDFTLSEDDRICSRVLSEAFHSVGYPIRPMEVIENRGNYHAKTINVASSLKHRGKSAAKLLAGGRISAAFNRLTDSRYVEIHLKGHRYITPADYDLSRFFSVIKDERDMKIDYQSARKICPISPLDSGQR